jgi:hypothetical protein
VLAPNLIPVTAATGTHKNKRFGKKKNTKGIESEFDSISIAVSLRQSFTNFYLM